MIRWFLEKLDRWVANSKKNRILLLKSKDLRSHDFRYRGVKDKNNPKLIELDLSRKSFEEIQIVFNPFNNRFDIFSPSVIKYNQRRIRRQTAKSSSHSKEYTRLLNLFHKEKFSKFISKDNKECDPNEILNDKSRIKWIIGDIGCGKSTFISHLCHNLIDKVNNGEHSVMCINFHEDELRAHYEKFNNHEEIVYAVLNEAFSRNFNDIPRINSIEDFVKVVRKFFLKKPLTIVIDNLDTFYDQSSLLILKQQRYDDEYQTFYKNQKYTHIAIEWLNLILKLLNSPDAPTNVNFIFGIRCETHDALIAAVHRQLNKPAIGLKIPDFERKILLNPPNIKDVIEKRFEMVREDISSSDDYSDLKDFFIKYGEYSIELKVHGMRHLISSLNRFCSMGDKGNRIFYPKWMIDIYVYLDGYEKYSQCDCGIINIFLVNINYRIDGDRKRNPKKYPEFSKENHFQTYWLRYFIALYFHKKLEKRAVDADTLYDANFSAYNRGIFNSSLLSLTKDTHGRLISCNHNHNREYAEDYILEKQNRLALFFSKEIFFSFTYLAVIIDDDYLEVPKLSDKKLSRLLEEVFEKPYIYKSIFVKNSDWEKWLFISINKVYVFLNILKVSFEQYETHNVNFLDDNDINFGIIFNNIEQQIREIAESLSISSEKINEEISKSVSFNKKIEKNLVSHFKNYKQFVEKRKSVEEVITPG